MRGTIRSLGPLVNGSVTELCKANPRRRFLRIGISASPGFVTACGVMLQDNKDASVSEGMFLGMAGSDMTPPPLDFEGDIAGHRWSVFAALGAFNTLSIIEGFDDDGEPSDVGVPSIASDLQSD